MNNNNKSECAIRNCSLCFHFKIKTNNKATHERKRKTRKREDSILTQNENRFNATRTVLSFIFRGVHFVWPEINEFNSFVLLANAVVATHSNNKSKLIFVVAHVPLAQQHKLVQCVRLITNGCEKRDTENG